MFLFFLTVGGDCAHGDVAEPSVLNANERRSAHRILIYDPQSTEEPSPNAHAACYYMYNNIVLQHQVISFHALSDALSCKDPPCEILFA